MPLPGSRVFPISSDRHALHIRASRIADWYCDASIKDESRWAEYQSWIIDRLVMMERVLRSVVKVLP
jgi:hypothetical protein